MDNHEHEKFMRRAIELSEHAGLKLKSGGVFGAVIVKNGEIIGEGYNRVMHDHDATCHAEIAAIRDAGKNTGNAILEGCILYTSAYCCPMCLCASYWAHIEKIYYAATVEDSLKYGNFNDLNYYQEIQKSPQERKIKMIEFMREEAVEIWKKFAEMPDRPHY